MREMWSDYEGAIRKLREDGREKLTRAEVTDLLGMSTSSFEREVKNNSMFIARCKAEPTGVATYYRRDELIEHFGRLLGEWEPAKLIYDRHKMKPDEFEETYGVTPDVAFAPDTYLVVGGRN